MRKKLIGISLVLCVAIILSSTYSWVISSDFKFADVNIENKYRNIKIVENTNNVPLEIGVANKNEIKVSNAGPDDALVRLSLIEMLSIPSVVYYKTPEVVDANKANVSTPYFLMASTYQADNLVNGLKLLRPPYSESLKPVFLTKEEISEYTLWSNSPNFVLGYDLPNCYDGNPCNVIIKEKTVIKKGVATTIYKGYVELQGSYYPYQDNKTNNPSEKVYQEANLNVKIDSGGNEYLDTTQPVKGLLFSNPTKTPNFGYESTIFSNVNPWGIATKNINSPFWGQMQKGLAGNESFYAIRWNKPIAKNNTSYYSGIILNNSYNKYHDIPANLSAPSIDGLDKTFVTKACTEANLTYENSLFVNASGCNYNRSKTSFNFSTSYQVSSLNKQLEIGFNNTKITTDINQWNNFDWYYNQVDGFFYYTKVLRATGVNSSTSNLINTLKLKSDSNRDQEYFDYTLEPLLHTIDVNKKGLKNSMWNVEVTNPVYDKLIELIDSN